MLDLTILILTKDETLHIERCIKSLSKIASRIVVVDSGSTDGTVELCNNLGVDVYHNDWVNYATQFQWGLTNTGISTGWVMRMDADEYLEGGLIEEIIDKLPVLDSNIEGIYLKRKVIFKGKWIKNGGFYPHVLLRIWRNGIGRIEQRWMDEHIVLNGGGGTVKFENDIVDYNLNDIGWWTDKHNSYATREMIDMLNIEHGFIVNDNALSSSENSQAKIKRYLKERLYTRLPLGVRPLLYFIYRYFFRLGFMDGSQGFVFHFLQGFWYRLLVDIKVSEVKDLSKKKNISIKDAVSEVSGYVF